MIFTFRSSLYGCGRYMAISKKAPHNGVSDSGPTLRFVKRHKLFLGEGEISKNSLTLHILERDTPQNGVEV